MAGLFSQFKPDRLSGFPLPDRCPIDSVSVWGDVFDLQFDDIAAAEFAIDGQIEHREIAGSSLGLKLAPYRPDVLWPEGRFCPVTSPCSKARVLLVTGKSSLARPWPGSSVTEDGHHAHSSIVIRSESRVSLSASRSVSPPIIPNGLIVAKDKSASPTWADVKAFLLTFDRAGLQGLVQDLYAASKDNQAFLHARFGLGPDQLGPYKATISRWINPDLMKNQTVSVSKAKKAIANYNKAIGRPEGLAELSIFFCEEAFSFVEGCSFSDERYFVALIRMYDQSVNRVLSLPLAERRAYVERLGKLRTRAKRVGWGVEDELNDLWHAADFDEQLE